MPEPNTPEPPVPAQPDGGGVPMPPSGAPVPPPAAPSGWGDSPRFGQYGQPAYGQYGQPGQPPTPQPQPGPYGPRPGAYPTAVKPGIVPLRPLTLGEIYDGAFGAVRHNPAVMLGISTLILLVASVVGVLVGQLLVPTFTGVFSDVFSDPTWEDAGSMFGVTAGTMGQLYGSGSGLALTTLLAGPIINGILTVSVSRSVLGDKAGVRDVWARVSPRVWLLIGWSLLQSLAAVVGIFVLVLAIAAVTVALAQVSGPLAGVVAVLLVVGSIVVIGWFVVRLLLVPAALALEGTRLWRSVKRTWLLTRGSFWRVFGIYLLATIIVYVISQAVAIPINIVASLVPGGDGLGALVVVSVVTGVLGAAIQTIFLGGVAALLYIDLRMRREGLDVQLTAAAAERQG